MKRYSVSHLCYLLQFSFIFVIDHTEGEMGSLQGPVVCPALRAKHMVVNALPVNGPLTKAEIRRSESWGFRRINGNGINVGRLHVRKYKKVQSSFNSSSNGNGSMAEINENDEDYVNCSVVEAGILNVSLKFDSLEVSGMFGSAFRECICSLLG